MFYSQNTTPDINHIANSQLEEHLIMDVTKKGFEYRYQCLQKEPMFEKPLTPSDVGKLNRLVIPKQHAENHLPPTGITNTGEKGILLSFEDESGKCWRFRYSYWTSSQSYVLTKGWSRFVKEKQLDAGDTVLFERQFVEGGCRLFIGWRRRNDTSDGAAHHQPDSEGNVQKQLQGGRSKILRLFGVNMECQPDEFEPPTQDGSSASSPGHASTHICMGYQYFKR